MSRLITTLALSAAATILTACTSGSPEPEPGAGATQSPAASATPMARTYDDRQLAGALPRSSAELRGLPLDAECRDLSTTCPQASDPGIGYVRSGRTAVLVFRDWSAGAWTEHLRGCPQGQYEQPLELTGKNSYTPGERGTSRRTDWTVGTWAGFVCEKTLVYLWPKNEHSDPTHSVYAFLNNGHHLLRVDGRSVAETRALVTGYLQRLEATTTS